MHIPFNKPFATGNELAYIQEAIEKAHLSGDGRFTKQCNKWIEETLGVKKALLTHSCTAALEMAAILADIQPGDEVIMPSYTFVSTANAFVLRGGVPVFVDIRQDTLNLDERLIEAAITPRTKAIVPVHYAGVGCDMDVIMEIATRYNLIVIEDAAQAMLSSYKGRALGSIGHMAAVSFHETKNLISGEGGALLINDDRFLERAEIIREKGTNRSKFFRGEVDKYTWVDVGSSYLPSELIAAFLWAQLESGFNITERRLAIWNRYNDAFAALETAGIVRRPVIPAGCEHNAHMYYLLLDDPERRDPTIAALKALGVGTVFHYVPLDSAPAGQRYARKHGELTQTHELSERLVRLPLWAGLEPDLDLVIDLVLHEIGRSAVNVEIESMSSRRAA
jgi:dTDP-4-amino-4,6-dideoxygalactose transaminase